MLMRQRPQRHDRIVRCICRNTHLVERVSPGIELQDTSYRLTSPDRHR